MTHESTILLPSTSTESLLLMYGEQCRAKGYYNINHGTQTVSYLTKDFKGTVYIQATVALDPIEEDWFTVDSSMMGGDSTVFTDPYYHITFLGNFTWVRVAYILENGTLEVRYW